MRNNLNTDEKKLNLTLAFEIEKQINQYCEQLKSEHLESIKNNEYSYDTGIIFTDIYSECEKIGNYTINVSKALVESK